MKKNSRPAGHYLRKLLNATLVMPRSAKRLIILIADALAFPAALIAAVWLKADGVIGDQNSLLMAAGLATVVGVGAFAALGVYHSVLRFLSLRDAFAIFSGVVLAAVAATFVGDLTDNAAISYGTGAIFVSCGLMSLGGMRLVARHLFNLLIDGGAQPLIIYGAGDSGRTTSLALAPSRKFRAVAFVDDKVSLQGTRIGGMKVYAPSELQNLLKRHPGASVLLALSAASRARRQEVLNSLAPLGVHVRSLPNLSEVLAGRARVDDIRELDTSDLLGRVPVAPVTSLFQACVHDKSVLVTGAGGSIGSEICRQVLNNGPKRLVLFELSELALYNLERELREKCEVEGIKVELVPLLGNVQHRGRLRAALQAYGVQTVYHAAAYKHVPIVENNVVEGIENNVLGTWAAAEVALEEGVELFMLVSTDKAVNPTNVMGATKRAAEMVLQGLQQRSTKTRFAMVRFGNVLASSGSVVPLFQEQIRRGGPVTVTHPDVIRYFMTIREAAQLVIQASAMAQGGDVFVLDMGQPVRIVELARRMIGLLGHTVRDAANPNGDIEIQFMGLRPAEKLYEELLIGKNVSGTQHPMIMRAIEHMLPWTTVQPVLDRLVEAVRDGDTSRALQLVQGLVVEYRPNLAVHDLLWNAIVANRSSDGKVKALPTRRSKRAGDSPA